MDRCDRKLHRENMREKKFNITDKSDRKLHRERMRKKMLNYIDNGDRKLLRERITKAKKELNITDKNDRKLDSEWIRDEKMKEEKSWILRTRVIKKLGRKTMTVIQLIANTLSRKNKCAFRSGTRSQLNIITHKKRDRWRQVSSQECGDE